MKNIQHLFILVLILMYSCTSAQETDLKAFEAYNKINFQYKLIFPVDYDAKKKYEMAFLFTETHKNDQGWAPSMESLKKAAKLNNMILVVPKIPLSNDHWKTHPIHHALNDLMKNLRDEYGVKGQKFHFIGYKIGQDVAQTYSNMSHEYVKSYSIVFGTYWKKNKQEWFDKVLDKNIPVYVYDQSDKKEIPLNISKTTFEKVASFSDAPQEN